MERERRLSDFRPEFDDFFHAFFVFPFFKKLFFKSPKSREYSHPPEKSESLLLLLFHVVCFFLGSLVLVRRRHEARELGVDMTLQDWRNLLEAVEIPGVRPLPSPTLANPSEVRGSSRSMAPGGLGGREGNCRGRLRGPSAPPYG